MNLIDKELEKKVTRAKFKCTSATQTSSTQSNGERGGVTEQLKMNAVYSADKEDVNYSWSLWTPSGELSLTITNPNLIGKFVPGQEYFIDISPVKE